MLWRLCCFCTSSIAIMKPERLVCSIPCFFMYRGHGSHSFLSRHRVAARQITRSSSSCPVTFAEDRELKSHRTANDASLDSVASTPRLLDACGRCSRAPTLSIVTVESTAAPRCIGIRWCAATGDLRLVIV